MSNKFFGPLRVRDRESLLHSDLSVWYTIPSFDVLNSTFILLFNGSQVMECSLIRVNFKPSSQVPTTKLLLILGLFLLKTHKKSNLSTKHMVVSLNFDQLLQRDGSVSIHTKNLRLLVTEIFKPLNKLLKFWNYLSSQKFKLVLIGRDVQFFYISSV